MRIEQSGTLTTPVPATPEEVLAVLADESEVARFVAPLLDESSRPTRWVVEPVRLGPVVVRPVAEVRHGVDGSTVRVVGTPVPRSTPTWIDVTMEVRGDGDTTTVDTSWHVRVDLHGPQFVARLARPMLDRESRTVTRALSSALVERFR